MSIESAIENAQQKVANAYTAVENKGGTLPATQNLSNLPTAINTISTAGTVETLNVTPTTSAQQFVPTGGVDGYNPVNVSAVTSDIDADIIASNIKQGVNILGVTGSVVELKGETKTVTPTTSQQTITPSSGKNGITEVTVNAVTSSIDNNITAGNIKKDVSILGVTGTYEGVTPTLTTKNITENGTYNASSDNADGYSSVTVNVSGGGGSTINEYANFITIPFNCTFDNMQEAINAYNQTMLNKGQNAANDLLTPYCQSSITLGETSNDIFHPINLGTSFYVGTKSFKGYLVANATTTENGGTLGNNYVRLASGNYTYITTTATGNLRNIKGNVFGNKIINFGALKEIYITNITSGNSVVEAILMPFVEKAVITSNAFYNFTKLKYISLPSLSDLTSEYALGSSGSVYSPFGNSLLKEICFPSLNSSSFGSYTNQFDNMLRDVTGCTVHFPSNLQSVIGNWTSVTGGFSGTNTTVLFDLPATT